MLFGDKFLTVEGNDIEEIKKVADGRFFIPVKCQPENYDWNKHPLVKKYKEGDYIANKDTK